MPRKKISSPTPTPSPGALALSEQHLRVNALDQEHQRLLKQIKKKRTELNNFVEQMRSVATKIFHRLAPQIEKINDIEQEIHALFEEILTTRKFGQKTRQDIIEIYESLQVAGLVSPKPGEEEFDPELDQLFERDASETEFSQDFADQNSRFDTPSEQQTHRTEESRKIRQTFLKLAEIFHPDKVKDSESQQQHNEIMKELNRAYQENDLAKLLEIEKQYLAGKSIEGSTEDELARKCQILEQQNSLLQQQYEHLKQELRAVKNTSEGELVSQYRQATKIGIDPLEQLLAETQKQIEIIAEIRDFVKNFRDKKITIKEFKKGPKCLRNLGLALQSAFLEEMLGISIEIIEF